MLPPHSYNKFAHHLAHPKYRPDIDGLRAIAVFFVVSFHAFPNRIQGGFIGVDIFFVISGFLISSIILASLEKDNFSFVEFYARRIKRIFPALLLVLIASYLFGWFVLLADEYKQLGKHIAGGAGFVSNFIFWNESGYFDNSAETKPLLHLWSLGIEEQFYILWPLLLWFAWKYRLNLLTISIFVVVTSFILNINNVHSNTIAAFYSPKTRFWELLIGSILAYLTLSKHNILSTYRQWLDKLLGIIIYATPPKADGNTLSNVQSFLGGLLIFIAFFNVTKENLFPGWWAVLPTTGAALIIGAGRQAWFNRMVLSNRVLVELGLISFPLYLWHWPLLSFAQILAGSKPTQGIRIAAVAVSIGLAWLTYRFIENPIRFGNHSKIKTIFLFISMIVVGSVGYNCYRQDGFVSRLNQQSFKNVFTYKTHWIGWQNCDAVQASASQSGGCKILKQNKPIDIAVIGDSHAGHLASGFKQLFSSRKENVAIMLSAGCYPFFPLTEEGQAYFNCGNNFIEKALLFAENTPSVKLVVLSGYAAFALYGKPYYEKINISQEQFLRNQKAFESGLQKTLMRLTKANKKIVYIVDSPELYKDPRSCVRSKFINFSSACSIDILKSDFIARISPYYKIIEENKKAFPNVIFSNTEEIFCDADRCYGVKNNVLLYASRDHLSPDGSRYFVSHISKLLTL
jgi:peptidoglycan/LPS O-acetylase OafA/YrhL